MMLQKYGKMVISLLNFKGWKDEQPASDFLVVPMCKFHPQFLGPSKHLPGLDVLGGYMAFYPLSSGQGDIAGNWTLGFKLISGRFLGIAKCPQDKMWKSPQSNKNHGKKRDPAAKVFQKSRWTPWWRIWTLSLDYRSRRTSFDVSKQRFTLNGPSMRTWGQGVVFITQIRNASTRWVHTSYQLGYNSYK